MVGTLTTVTQRDVGTVGTDICQQSDTGAGTQGLANQRAPWRGGGEAAMVSSRQNVIKRGLSRVQCTDQIKNQAQQNQT